MNGEDEWKLLEDNVGRNRNLSSHEMIGFHIHSEQILQDARRVMKCLLCSECIPKDVWHGRGNFIDLVISLMPFGAQSKLERSMIRLVGKAHFLGYRSMFEYDYTFKRIMDKVMYQMYKEVKYEIESEKAPRNGDLTKRAI